MYTCVNKYTNKLPEENIISCKHIHASRMCQFVSFVALVTILHIHTYIHIHRHMRYAAHKANRNKVVAFYNSHTHAAAFCLSSRLRQSVINTRTFAQTCTHVHAQGSNYGCSVGPAWSLTRTYNHPPHAHTLTPTHAYTYLQAAALAAQYALRGHLTRPLAAVQLGARHVRRGPSLRRMVRVKLYVRHAALASIR
jgi:hypothetical protein